MGFKFSELNALADAYEQMINRSAATALAFVKDRFARQNWIGDTTQPWRRSRKSKGNTLVETAALKRSIRIAHKSRHRIVIATDSKYAKIHNEGGKIPVTPKMRGYFFYRAKQLQGNVARRKDGRARQTRRNQALGEDAQKYINMATTKKKAFVIPKRQFMGASPYLDKQIERVMLAEINKALKPR